MLCNISAFLLENLHLQYLKLCLLQTTIKYSLMQTVLGKSVFLMQKENKKI